MKKFMRQWVIAVLCLTMFLPMLPIKAKADAGGTTAADAIPASFDQRYDITWMEDEERVYYIFDVPESGILSLSFRTGLSASGNFCGDREYLYFYDNGAVKEIWSNINWFFAESRVLSTYEMGVEPGTYVWAFENDTVGASSDTGAPFTAFFSMAFTPESHVISVGNSWIYPEEIELNQFYSFENYLYFSEFFLVEGVTYSLTVKDLTETPSISRPDGMKVVNYTKTTDSEGADTYTFTASATGNWSFHLRGNRGSISQFQFGSEITEGWYSVYGKWYYFHNGFPVYGVYSVNGKLECFGDKYGSNPREWQEKTGSVYTVGADGKYHQYYFDENHQVITGWFKPYEWSNWYYADPVTGAVATGLCKIEGKVYFLNYEGEWPSTTFGWKQVGDDYHYFDTNGVGVTGWKNIDGKWYYFEPEWGVMQKGLVKADGKVYFFNSTGVWQTYKGWKSIDGKWYYFDTNSAAATGWKKVDGIWYYFNNNAVMQTGMQTVEGKKYFFAPSGAMATGWKQMNGSWYYFGTDGAMKTGWQKVDNVWYYFTEEGVMSTNWQMADGKWYYFGSDGGMKTGWKKVDGAWYYLNSEMKTNWQKIDGTWYYMGSNGAMRTGWQNIGNVWYYFGSDGAMRTGWKQIDGVWYYFKSSGAMTSNETLTIDGTSYSFAPDGAWME